MKKILLCVSLFLGVIFCCACSIQPPLPSNGIWYCEEIGITMNFDEEGVPGRWYITDTQYTDINVHLGFDGEIVFSEVVDDQVYYDERDLYVGYYRYQDNKFVVTLYSKINLEDPNGDLIAVEQEKVVFEKIENFNQVKQ